PTCTTIPACGARAAPNPCEETAMTIDDKLAKAGLTVPNLEDLYRTNASGAHYISHFPVQNLLYLSGTTPRKDGQGYLPGVGGKPTRAAIGCQGLGGNASVEIIATVLFTGSDVRPPLARDHVQK